MFTNTVSSRSSSSNSLRMRNPLSPKTSYNPLFRHSDALTSFDASHFVFQEEPKSQRRLRRYHSQETNSENNTATPDSNTSGSRNSTGGSDIVSVEYEAREFLERYSLPRVVRVEGGDPLLLYRCFDSFTKIQAKGLGKRQQQKEKERSGTADVLYFPEGYSGWFSLTNEKGEKSAIVHTSILQLVREQVCSFLSMQPMTAYASQTTDVAENKSKVQYLKTQMRAGQLFQLRAVFQHRDSSSRNSTSRSSSRISRSLRDKDLANRYAQLVSQNNQEIYVPLTTKGEFYEIHSSMKARLCFPGMLDKTGPLALDKDCLYKITHLLRRVALPIRVKLITGPLPQALPKDFTDSFILEKKFHEPLMVTCTLPPPNQDIITHQISCINLNSNVKLCKSTLGFDSENRLFKSQRLQAALAFCHKNVESWYREVRIAPDCFLSKFCLECRNDLKQCICIKTGDTQKQIITKEAMEKFAAKPETKKWYRHLNKFLTRTEDRHHDILDGMEKNRSIDRYKDMSKLIEEKFGKKSYNPVKKSASFMFQNKRIEVGDEVESNPALLKCQSLDTQLYTINDSHKGKASLRSYDFQMCILEDSSNLDEIKTLEDDPPPVKLKKTKPDLIPTLPKATEEQSFITERLCNEFHVKTKVQKKSIPKTVTVQVHERKDVNVDEVPYSHVADEVRQKSSTINKGLLDENIYAEICETACVKCDRTLCECDNRTKMEYCYVKLGSNGDSVTQSDSDEAIYNTLR